MRLLEMPSSNGIIEDDKDTRLYDKVNENEESSGAALWQNKVNDNNVHKNTCNSKNKNSIATVTADVGVGVGVGVGVDEITTTTANITNAPCHRQRTSTLPE